MAQVYKTGTPLTTIIQDGWARGFEATQTVEEAQASGYKITLEQVQSYWAVLTEQFNVLPSQLVLGS